MHDAHPCVKHLKRPLHATLAHGACSAAVWLPRPSSANSPVACLRRPARAASCGQRCRGAPCVFCMRAVPRARAARRPARRCHPPSLPPHCLWRRAAVRPSPAWPDMLAPLSLPPKCFVVARVCVLCVGSPSTILLGGRAGADRRHPRRAKAGHTPWARRGAAPPSRGGRALRGQPRAADPPWAAPAPRSLPKERPRCGAAPPAAHKTLLTFTHALGRRRRKAGPLSAPAAWPYCQPGERSFLAGAPPRMRRRPPAAPPTRPLGSATPAPTARRARAAGGGRRVAGGAPQSPKRCIAFYLLRPHNSAGARGRMCVCAHMRGMTLLSCLRCRGHVFAARPRARGSGPHLCPRAARRAPLPACAPRRAKPTLARATPD
ncbi:MAG: hypothetical protein J3K34DRAFT_244527 [Monoraphidium minutum]|nr:MAG: hypothetical protein J3K34DRAFT_244527 [Monoraphidium minutum]